MNSDGNARRVAESAGMLMIGDGVLGILRPAEHCIIWRTGPQWWRDTVDWFAVHPQLTRGAAFLELGAGLCLALQSQQTGAVRKKQGLSEAAYTRRLEDADGNRCAC